MSADLFEDPGQALLARGSADPIEQLQLTQAEEDQIDVVREEANSARTLAHVGVVLGAAFLVYRAVVERRTKEQISSQPESRVLQALALRNARNFIPAWVYMVTPALETAYNIGAIRAGSKMPPDTMVSQFAERYAVDIANYFNETSAQAMTEGFNLYVNRKLARRVAAEKVLGAFGLNSKMMRALVGRVARGKIDSVIEINHDASTTDWIELMLVQRAHDIGDQEGFNVSQHGKQITWLYLQKTGVLSAAALKVWHTARDERVCPACGPLDKQAVPIGQPFNTAYGKLWVPSMHPNCRCEVRLRSSVREEFTLAKAADWEEREHPRARDGRFRNKPSQRPVAERERETDLERLLREVRERPAPQIEVEQPVEFQKPVSLTGAPEGQVSLGQDVSLGRTDVNLAPVSLTQEAEAVALGQPSVALPAQAISFDLSPVQLQQATVALQDAATTQMGVSLAERVKAPIKAPAGIINLPETLYRLDPAGFHYYEGASPHLDLSDEGDHAIFDPEHEFTNLPGVMDQIHTLYTREIEREVQRIMLSSKNFIRAEGQSLDNALVLSEDHVRLAITAEILGTDEPELRSYAQAMGVHRNDWITARYRMDRAWANGFEGDLHAHGETEFYSAPGRYYVEEDMVPRDGWPVIDYDVEPEEEEGIYSDWYNRERDDWPPS
jgi:hypothetical protein